MVGNMFQFRVCRNPACGLRYPAPEDNSFGERCPACLGETDVVAVTRAEREAKDTGEAAGAARTGAAGLLDNVRSVWNTGSIFRSAEGFGFRQLYLCGITPTPDNESMGKTALGAQDVVPYSAHKDAVKLVRELKRRGSVVWALERTSESRALQIVMKETGVPDGLVLAVGNEQAGIDPELLELADEVVHIEMSGVKRSFNVAIAFSVAAATLRGKPNDNGKRAKSKR